jgi:fermentation-respiration switch protein FrsA (DUF1100 family)
MLIYIGAAYFAWCLVLYLAQDSLMWAPQYARATAAAPPYERGRVMKIELDSGGFVDAVFVPAPEASAEHPCPVVILCHGNAEQIDQQQWFVKQFSAMGVSVFIPEYRGYGRASGKPSQRAIGQDIVRLREMMLKQPEVDATRVVYYGRSIGGGVACDLASKHRPAALILQSTYTSAASMAWSYGAPPFLVTSPFRNAAVIAAAPDLPLLIFHGSQDQVIPVSHGRALHHLSPKSVYVEYDADHLDFPPTGKEEDFWQHVRAFLAENRILER